MLCFGDARRARTNGTGPAAAQKPSAELDETAEVRRRCRFGDARERTNGMQSLCATGNMGDVLDRAHG